MLYAYFHRMKGNAGNLYETELAWPEKAFIVRLLIWFVQPHKWMNDGLAEKNQTSLVAGSLQMSLHYFCVMFADIPPSFFT